MDLRVDILIAGLPENSTIEKSPKQPLNNLLEINLKIALQQMEDHNHIDNSKESNDNRTQQVQYNNPIRDPIVTQNTALIIGDPEHEHNERL